MANRGKILPEGVSNALLVESSRNVQTYGFLSKIDGFFKKNSQNFQNN